MRAQPLPGTPVAQQHRQLLVTLAPGRAAGPHGCQLPLLQSTGLLLLLLLLLLGFLRVHRWQVSLLGPW